MTMRRTCDGRDVSQERQKLSSMCAFVNNLKKKMKEVSQRRKSMHNHPHTQAPLALEPDRQNLLLTGAVGDKE